MSKRNAGTGKAAMIQAVLPHARQGSLALTQGLCLSFVMGALGFSMGSSEDFQVLLPISLVHPSRGQQEVPWAPIGAALGFGVC